MSTSKRHALITGVSGGLGSTVAKLLLENNFIVTGINNTNPVPDGINNHPQFTTINQDFRQNILSTIDTVNCVIICHGKNFITDPLSYSAELMDDSFKINFLSVLQIAQSYIKLWRKQQQSGHIVYISSVATKLYSPQEIAYHAMKSASESALKGLAREFAADRIYINMVSPGLMNTNMGLDVIKNRPDVLTRIPTGSLVNPGDVADMILTILESTSISGSNIAMNNGRWLEG